MTPDLPLLDQLRADLEQSLSPGDLGLDRFDAEALGLDFDALTPDDITLDTQIQTRIHDPLKTRMLHPVLVRYEHAEQLARDLGPLAEVGARAHAVVSGNFIFGDFIEAWICEHDWTVPNLHIGTLSLSAENIDSLANLLIGEWVQRLHLTVPTTGSPTSAAVTAWCPMPTKSSTWVAIASSSRSPPATPRSR